MNCHCAHCLLPPLCCINVLIVWLHHYAAYCCHHYAAYCCHHHAAYYCHHYAATTMLPPLCCHHYADCVFQASICSCCRASCSCQTRWQEAWQSLETREAQDRGVQPTLSAASVTCVPAVLPNPAGTVVGGWHSTIGELMHAAGAAQWMTYCIRICDLNRLIRITNCDEADRRPLQQHDRRPLQQHDCRPLDLQRQRRGNPIEGAARQAVAAHGPRRLCDRPVRTTQELPASLDVSIQN